ncbi:MAG: hydantoinase/oxoprolinase family protein [Pseudomonadota bacterium]
MADNNWRIGIDIGGTFTDVALVEEVSGRIGVVKVPTTPDDFGRGVLEGVQTALVKYGIGAEEVSLLSHATTVVTNAVLEQKGARCALVATRGFRDVLELRRSSRPDLYDLFQDAPHVLIPRRHRFEITERVGADGAVVTALAEDEIPALIDAIRAAEPEAIAVSLLFSFLNPDHEQRLGAALRSAFPDIPVYLSSEVLPEIREFERTSTTAVCAYVGPILGAYLARLSEAVGSLGLPDLYVMGSNGGVFEAREGVAMPAMAVESGPAAGVVAAALVAEQTGHRDILSFDMGGTTAKASLIRDAAYETTPEYEVGGGASGSRTMHGTGHPIRVPVIDLAEVSAGGGSIAWVDRAGALRVGPHSAGAVPGPVCYRRGGTEPTVTDCNLVLGYLDQGSLLGGEMEIDLDAARTAIETKLAQPLGIDLRTAAAGVIDVVNHEMAEALRIVSVQRGHDPRDFTLSAFGGAGPLHAAALAEELEMRHVLCPPIPGAFSALGLVTTDLRRDYARTFFARTDQAEAGDLAVAFEALAMEGRAMLDRAGVPEDRQRLVRTVDARYGRQSYELVVPVPDPPFSVDVMDRIAEAFHARHAQTYGHARPDEPVQLVNVRLSAVGEIPAIRLGQAPGDGAAETGTRAVWFRHYGEHAATVLRRETMGAGQSVSGAAVIESLESTILVPPGWTARMDADGFVHLDRQEASA